MRVPSSSPSSPLPPSETKADSVRELVWRLHKLLCFVCALTYSPAPWVWCLLYPLPHPNPHPNLFFLL